MAIDILKSALEKMILLHKSMNQIAKQKKEIIIKGDLETLQNILKVENKHMLAIKKVEQELKSTATAFLQGMGKSQENITLTDVINNTEVRWKDYLTSLKMALNNEITELVRQNELNQALLEQSLQFVNMSLDLLLPDIESFNYERGSQVQQTEQKGRSIFDSKA